MLKSLHIAADQPTRQQSASAASSHYRSPALDSQDYQSDDDIDSKFLELERQTLESMMQASQMDSQQSGTGSDQRQERVSSGSTASSSGAATSSSSSSSGGDWWHRASRMLQQVQGHISPLESHQAQSMARDVTTLLTRIVNARVMRGMDPTAAQLVDLAVFQVGVSASADPKVRIAPPRTDFTVNIRQRLFRDATAVALEACQRSAASSTTAAWQELAANWSKHVPDRADAASPAGAGKLAHMFLRSLAELFKLEQKEVERIVHAAVAAHTRAKLLTAHTAVKQVRVQHDCLCARETISSSNWKRCKTVSCLLTAQPCIDLVAARQLVHLQQPAKTFSFCRLNSLRGQRQPCERCEILLLLWTAFPFQLNHQRWSWCTLAYVAL